MRRCQIAMFPFLLCLLLIAFSGTAQAQGFTASYTVGATHFTLPSTSPVPPMAFTNSLFNSVVQTVTLTPTGPPIGVVVAINNPSSTPWLHVNPTGPVNIPAGGFPLSVSVDTANLPNGTYAGSFQIQSTAPVVAAITITVTLTIGGTGGGGGTSPLSVTSSSTLPNATAGQPYLFTFQANGGTGTGYVWSVTAGALPSNFVLDPSGNLFSSNVPAVPSLPSGFPYTFTAQVRDSAGASASQQFTVFLFNTGPPRISTTSLPQGNVGMPYAATINVSGGQAPFIWSLNGTLPPGLILIYSNGPFVTITGTPTASGIATFLIRVADSTSSSSTQTLTLTIVAASSSLVSLSPPSVGAGSGALTLIVSGSGFLFGSTVQWNGVSLPTSYLSGLQLSAAVPQNLVASAGTASVTVVNPGGGVSNALGFAINSPGLSITTGSLLPPGLVGTPYSLVLAAAGGSPPYKSWTVIGGAPPPGILLSAGGGALSGLLSGTPTAPGTYFFMVQMLDNTNTVATKQFVLAISSVSISTNGVVNAASYQAGSISPGEIVTIFGSNLGPSSLASLQLDSKGFVATSLAGTQVLFDGVPAPMVYASAGQVSAVVPYVVAGTTFALVQVFYQGQSSNVVSIPVALTEPGIFTRASSGLGQGAIINQDGTLNLPGNPASVGSVVSIYATGEGQTNPPGLDGKPGDSPAPLPLAQPVSAIVGGISAQVLYAGGAPGLVAGVFQVNVRIPQGVTPGTGVPITIQVGGQSSQTGVTLAVR